MKAVFLDRDGVLIRSDVVDGTPVPAPEHEILPGVIDACGQLRASGRLLVMVTNQPDIARGTVTLEHVETANDALRSALELDDIRICPHDDRDGCHCRKPLPGMLLDAARDLSIDLSASVIVGDRWRDIEAGRRAGTRTVFVDHGYAERRPEDPDLVVSSLLHAVPTIVANTWEVS